MARKTNLIRKQMDAKLQHLALLKDMPVPSHGWIKAVRAALGISAERLARRIGVIRQAVARVEHDEVVGTVTIKTMRRVAEGLDCVFVYAIIPRTSLEDTVRAQARKLAQQRVSRASKTMELESQGLSDLENEDILEQLVDEIVNDPPRSLWDTQ